MRSWMQVWGHQPTVVIKDPEGRLTPSFTFFPFLFKCDFQSVLFYSALPHRLDFFQNYKFRALQNALTMKTVIEPCENWVQPSFICLPVQSVTYLRLQVSESVRKYITYCCPRGLGEYIPCYFIIVLFCDRHFTPQHFIRHNTDVQQWNLSGEHFPVQDSAWKKKVINRELPAKQEERDTIDTCNSQQ